MMLVEKIFEISNYFLKFQDLTLSDWRTIIMSNLLLDIFASGIDFNLPGNGGPDCLAHTSYSGRALESTVSVLTFATAIIAGFKVIVILAITKNCQWFST